MGGNVQVCEECTQRCLHIHTEKAHEPTHYSNSPSFFKIMFPSSFSEFLYLPPAFVCGEANLLGQVVSLEDVSRKKWDVKLCNVKGRLAFKEGWSKFVLDHSLKCGEFLVFTYISASHFLVKIYGITACENSNISIANYTNHVNVKDTKVSDRKSIPGKLKFTIRKGRISRRRKALGSGDGEVSKAKRVLQDASPEAPVKKKRRMRSKSLLYNVYKDEAAEINCGSKDREIEPTSRKRCNKKKDLRRDAPLSGSKRTYKKSKGPSKVIGGKLSKEEGNSRCTIDPSDLVQTFVSKSRFEKRKSSSDTKDMDRFPQVPRRMRDFKEKGVRNKPCPKRSIGKAHGKQQRPVLKGSLAAEPLKLKKERVSFDDPSQDSCSSKDLVTVTSHAWLELPLTFHENRKGPNKSLLVLRDPTMTLWPVVHHSTKDFNVFGEGWKSFYVANDIKEGDACKFEVVDGLPEMYQVSIYKEI